MRFIAMIILILSAFFVTSRLQVNENARFVTRHGEVLEGKVSREFVTGAYKIERVDQSIRYVNQDDLGAMSFEGPAIPAYASVLGLLLIFAGALVGFGLDSAAFQAIRSRASKNADKAIANRQAQLESSVREQMSK